MTRVNIVVLLGVGVMALSCDRNKTRSTVNVDRTPTTGDERATQAQKASEQALDQAKKAQEEATKQQEQVTKAEKTRAEKSSAMKKAEADLARERQEAQQAQREAQQKSQAATQTAQQAQNRALNAQEEATRTTAANKETRSGMSPTTAEGTVSQIDSEHLMLDRASGPELRLKITPSVPVSGTDENGQARNSVDDVAVGTPVRVKYHLEANQPVAEQIELASGPRTIH